MECKIRHKNTISKLNILKKLTILLVYIILIILGIITKKYNYYFTSCVIITLIGLVYIFFKKRYENNKPAINDIKIVNGIEVCAV